MKKYLFYILIILFLSSCKTVTPVIINDPPTANMKDDMTIEEYLHSTTEYRINIQRYIDELINQIIHKVPYIDMRSPAGKGIKKENQKKEDKEDEAAN